MLPRLEAEESILAATRGRVGSGTLRTQELRSIQSSWQNLARARTPVVKATPDMLETIGIKVTRVPPSKEPA